MHGGGEGNNEHRGSGVRFIKGLGYRNIAARIKGENFRLKGINE